MAIDTESSTAGRATKQVVARDRFDDVSRASGRGGSRRVGAHRVEVRPRHVWKYLIAGLIGFAVLTTVGILSLQLDAVTLPTSITGTPAATAKPERIEPVLDPAAAVAIINGTPITELEMVLDETITANAWGTVVFAGPAATSDVAISAVFYRDVADRPAAAGLAAQLGGLSTYQTEQYGEYDAKLIVLLGADYAGPGLEEAQQRAAGLPAEDGVDGVDGAGEGVEGVVDPETGNAIDPETGYQIDPQSGYLIDPATGYLIDPETGSLIDPASGELIQ